MLTAQTIRKMRLKRRVLEGSWSLLSATGADQSYVRRHSLSGATILMYHAVTDHQNGPWTDPAFSLSKEQFERQIDFLARNRHVISLTELTDMIDAGITAPVGTVVITFDDGYLDTLRTAGPILKRYQLPATVFVVSGWVETVTAPWIDLLFSSINHRQNHSVRIDETLFDLTTEKGELACYRKLGGMLLNASPRDRDTLWGAIHRQLNPKTDGPNLLMTWDDIGSWLDMGDGYEVGVHTKTHSAMSLLDKLEDIQHEVSHGTKELARRFGVKNPHFSYPYGMANDLTTKVLRASDCRSALLTEPLRRTTHQSDPYELSREGAPGSIGRLGFLTSGAYPELSQTLFRRQ